MKVNIPIQLINYSDGDDNPFVQSRNIIIIDDDAEVTFCNVMIRIKQMIIAFLIF